MTRWQRLQCWWRHAWAFRGGRWVIPHQLAFTNRQCTRCGLYQEIAQDHMFGANWIELSEMRPLSSGVHGGGDVKKENE